MTGGFAALAGELGVGMTAGALAGGLADYVTGESGEFLLLESVTASQIALWLVICASVIMVVGKFGETIVEKGCGLASGLGLSILFVQYCRTVEEMDHYIIFSLVVFIVSAGIFSFFQGKRGDWSCGSYFYDMWGILALYPILFWIYTILSETIGLSKAFCLAAASVLILLATIGCVRGMADD